MTLWLLCVVLGTGMALAEDPPAEKEASSLEAQHAESPDLVAGGEISEDSAEGSAAGEVATETEAISREERRRRQLERNLESVQRNVWWNRPRVIESLELEVPQRHAMDQTLDDYLRRVLQPEPESEPLLAFRDALGDGDLELAQRHLSAIGEHARKRGMEEGEMMLQVLGQLTEEQMETLRQRHGLLLQRNWVKLVSNHRRGRLGAGRGGGVQSGSGGGSSRGGGG